MFRYLNLEEKTDDIFLLRKIKANISLSKNIHILK